MDFIFDIVFWLIGNVVIGGLRKLFQGSGEKARESEGEVQQEAASMNVTRPQGIDEISKVADVDVWEEYRKKQDALSAKQKE
jgi:hypothetical protein